MMAFRGVDYPLSKNLVIAALLALGCLAGNAVFATDFQEQVGFSPGHVFEAGQFGENVDVTTGNLTLTVPIGPTYQVNDLAHRVTLTYNSKIWEYEHPWILDPNDASYEASREPWLKMTSPYGVGWTYHEGRLYIDPNSPYLAPKIIHYESPDGARHPLYADDLANPLYYFSKDGTYLRARAYTVYEENDPLNSTMRVWKLWEPDGSSRVLGFQVGVLLTVILAAIWG